MIPVNDLFQSIAVFILKNCSSKHKNALILWSLSITPICKMIGLRDPYKGQLLIFFSMNLLWEETESYLSLCDALRQWQHLSPCLHGPTHPIYFSKETGADLSLSDVCTSGCSFVITEHYSGTLQRLWSGPVDSKQDCPTETQFKFILCYSLASTFSKAP